jgi:hypothetical protein|tara:strand:- start:56 stop:475 length:420 start_codon:yes stop_codon:yes gene_type:complete
MVEYQTRIGNTGTPELRDLLRALHTLIETQGVRIAKLEDLLSAAYSRGLLEEIGALQDADMAGHMQKGVDEMDRVIDLEAASGLLGIKPSTLHTHLRRRREAGKLVPFVKMSHPRGQKYMTTVGELRQWAKVELGRDLA